MSEGMLKMQLEVKWLTNWNDIGIKITGIERRIRQVAVNGVNGIAKKAKQELAELTPSGGSLASTGLLKESWDVDIQHLGYGVKYDVYNKDPRAYRPIAIRGGGSTSLLEILEYGTSQHRITARKAKALHFINKAGDEVFMHSVHHPGQAAYGMRRIAGAKAVKRMIGLHRTIMIIISRGL